MRNPLLPISTEGRSKICVTCADKFLDKLWKLTIFPGPPPGQHWAPARNLAPAMPTIPLFINDDGIGAAIYAQSRHL